MFQLRYKFDERLTTLRAEPLSILPEKLGGSKEALLAEYKLTNWTFQIL